MEAELRLWGLAALAAIMSCTLACDPYRDTRPIIVNAKPPLIEHQFCLALHDAEHESQDSVVMTGTAVHGTPDLFRVTCEGQTHELLFALAPPPDDLGMKELRRQWNKRTGGKSAECIRCPKFDLTAKFVGMVKRDETQRRLIYIAQGADDVRRTRINYRSRKNESAAEAALKSNDR
jgi:hypothetical protein